MRVFPMVLVLLTSGCGGSCRRPLPGAVDGGDLDQTALPSASRDAPPVRAACRPLGRQPVPSLEHAADGGLESLVAAPSDGGVRVLWSTSGSAALRRWSSGQTAPLPVESGAGERSDPVLATDGRGAFAAAWVSSRMGAREHVLWTSDAEGGRCTGAEGRDEGLSLSLAGLARGWLIAWDEVGPAPAAGSVRVQLASVGANGVLCGAQRTISPAAQDAADPLAVSLPGGGAAVFWLTARDVDATESNDTATDVWGVAVGPDGAPAGPPLRVTRTVDHHFGLSALATQDAVWLGLRGGGPSDSEGRGDGGEVRLVRVDVGPRGLARAGDMAVVSDEGANPTGAPRVTRPLTAGAAAEVWWRERRGERVEIRHRPVDPGGRPLMPSLPAFIEPAMGAALPSWVDERAQAWAVRVEGERAEVARFACGGP